MTQKLKSKYLPVMAWIIPTIMLLLALVPLSDGYYNLLHIVVSVLSGVIVYRTYKSEGVISDWLIVFLFIALLYNPFMRIRLDVMIWNVLNSLTAVIFIGHMIWYKKIIMKR